MTISYENNQQVKNRIDDSLVERLLFYAILYIVFDGYVYLKNIL